MRTEAEHAKSWVGWGVPRDKSRVSTERGLQRVEKNAELPATYNEVFPEVSRPRCVEPGKTTLLRTKTVGTAISSFRRPRWNVFTFRREFHKEAGPERGQEDRRKLDRA